MAVTMLQDSLGPQQLSTLQSAPVPGFGTCKRPGMAERTRAPGPGAYKARPALGAPLFGTPHAAHPQQVDMGVSMCLIFSCWSAQGSRWTPQS